MKTKKSKDNGSKGQGMDFGFCNPSNLQGMFEKMGQCCAGQDNVMNCSSMPGGMMEKMMDIFCPTNHTDLKENASQQKDDGE